MKEAKASERGSMSDFSKRLCDLLREQYKHFPLESVLFAESRDKLEIASGEKADSAVLEKDGTVGSYVKLYNAYAQAEDGDVESIRGYLDVVFELLDRDDKSKKDKQLWIPSNKESVSKKKKFYKNWKRLLMAFIAEEYLPEADDNINRKWIQNVFKTAKEHIETGRDTELELEAIARIQSNLKAGFIQDDVESNLSSLDSNSRIKKSLLDKCVDDEYFSELFSSDKTSDKTSSEALKEDSKEAPKETSGETLNKVSDKKKSGDKDSLEKNFAMFFRIMENGMDEKMPGSEQYRYLLIPLYVDSLTGVSMCIVGRNYFYEKKSFLPCILQVMRLSDVGQRLDNGMSAIYEPAHNYDRVKELKPLHTVYGRKSGSDENEKETVRLGVRRKVCWNYFKSIYAEYNDAVRNARLLLREIDIEGMKGYLSQGEVPEELGRSPFYAELLRPLDKTEKTREALRTAVAVKN